MSESKPLLCKLGFHKWHEHTLLSPGYYIRRSNPCLYYYDRVCVRCHHEDNRASERYARDRVALEAKIQAEQRVLERRS